MKELLICITILLIQVKVCFGCLNEYVTDSSGNRIMLTHSHNSLLKFYKEDEKKLLAKLQELEKKAYTTPSLENCSNYAINIIKVGKYKDGLQLLLQLYKHYPNEYNILANLGTAFELNAQNDSALYYIKKSVELNPNAHNGTEWIHIAILERKLGKRNKIIDATITSKWLENQICEKMKLLGIEMPMIHSTDGKQQLQTKKYLLLYYQVMHQLNERLPFTPKQDEYVAELCQEFADILFTNFSKEKALLFYNLGYYYANKINEKLLTKIEHIKSTVSKDDLFPYTNMYKEFKKEFSKNTPLNINNYVVIDTQCN